MNIREDGILVEPRFRSNLGGSPRTSYPLHAAAAKYDGDELQRILKENGRTPLHVLLLDKFSGHLFQVEMENCLRVLIGGGCDINARDGKGESPLSLAVLHGFESAARELVGKGADTTIRTERFPKEHSLASAIGGKMPEVMMAILDSGISHNGVQGELAEVTLDWRKLLQYSTEDDLHPPPKTGFYERWRKPIHRELSFLYSLLDTPSSSVSSRYLRHPLISAFLHLRISTRWKSLAFSVVYLFAYLAFVNVFYFGSCRLRKEDDEDEQSWDITTDSTTLSELPPKLTSTSKPARGGVRMQDCDMNWGITTIAIILFLVVAMVGMCLGLLLSRTIAPHMKIAP